MTKARRLLGVVALATLVVGEGASTQETARPASGLQRLLDAEVARFPGRAGVWVKHLTSGEEASVRADELFNSASVIKIPVMVLAFRLSAYSQFLLEDRVMLTAADVRGGSGVLRYHDPGLQPTLRDILMQMIATSDNTATDIAIAKVGGVERVNSLMRTLGYGNAIKLNMTTGELFAMYGQLQASLRNEKTNSDRSYWLGEMSPRATGRMLEAIQRCNDGSAPEPVIASKSACTDMMRMLRAQQSGARRLPHFLTVPVAHKTGDFPPVIANDVGVVFARSGPIVIAFFANSIEGSYGEAEDRIGRIAQMILAYFDGAA